MNDMGLPLRLGEQYSRPSGQTSLFNLRWKDFYISGSDPRKAKFNIVPCDENHGLPHNAWLPDSFASEIAAIHEICRSEDFRDLETFRLDMGDYKVRISQTMDFRGDVSISGRYISTTIPNFMDPKWGYDPVLIDTILKWLNRPGYFLVMGKTGSGKTQLLMSAIYYLMGQGSYVIRTAEDPVEFELPVLTDTCNTCQWEVREHTDWVRFLTHMVRTNPDIAGCGELRDGESATTFFSVGAAGPAAFATTHGMSLPAGMQRLYNIAKTGSMGEAASEAMADGFLGAIHISLQINPLTGMPKPVTTILDATLSDVDNGSITNAIRSQQFKALDPIVDRQSRSRKSAGR